MMALGVFGPALFLARLLGPLDIAAHLGFEIPGHQLLLGRIAAEVFVLFHIDAVIGQMAGRQGAGRLAAQAAGDGVVGDGFRGIEDQIGLGEALFGGRGGLLFLFDGKGLVHGGQSGRRGLFDLHRLLGLRVDPALDGHIKDLCLFVLLHDEFDGLVAVFVENGIKNIFVFQSHRSPSFYFICQRRPYMSKRYFSRNNWFVLFLLKHIQNNIFSIEQNKSISVFISQ